MMRIFKAWYDAANTARRLALAAAADSSVDALWQMATGRRPASARKAAEIEVAAKTLGEPLRRGDICRACAECPYYQEIVAREEVF